MFVRYSPKLFDESLYQFHIADLRQMLFNKFIRFSPADLAKTTSGELLSRISNDVQQVQNCLGQQLVEVVRAPFIIIFALTAMAIISWKLLVTILCLAPLLVWIISVVGKRILLLSRAIQDRYAEYNSRLLERLANLRIIRAFVREDYEIVQLEELNERCYRSTSRLMRGNELLPASVEFIAFVGVITGVVFGGVAVFHGEMTSANFLLFLVPAPGKKVMPIYCASRRRKTAYRNLFIGRTITSKFSLLCGNKKAASPVRGRVYS